MTTYVVIRTNTVGRKFIARLAYKDTYSELSAAQAACSVLQNVAGKGNSYGVYELKEVPDAAD